LIVVTGCEGILLGGADRDLFGHTPIDRRGHVAQRLG
jgi:hypothetical protein